MKPCISLLSALVYNTYSATTNGPETTHDSTSSDIPKGIWSNDDILLNPDDCVYFADEGNLNCAGLSMQYEKPYLVSQGRFVMEPVSIDLQESGSGRSRPDDLDLKSRALAIDFGFKADSRLVVDDDSMYSFEIAVDGNKLMLTQLRGDKGITATLFQEEK